MPEQLPTMDEWRQARKALHDRLKELVPEEDYTELFHQLDIVTGVEPHEIRDRQFLERSRVMLVEIQAASDRNVPRHAAALRRFAEEVARHLLPDIPEEQLLERIDAIPDLEEE